MRKISIILLLLATIVSCKTTQEPFISTELYEVLTGDEYTGGSFRFYEIISTPEEFRALLSDEELSKFIKKKDIETANFIIVNLGEKDSEGYLIKVKSVKELNDKIVVAIEEIEPKKKSKKPVITKPYCVIKINSKKDIEIL